MQHHTNASRAPSHMRGAPGHHHMTMHMNNVPQHIPTINSMVPQPPPPTASAVPYQQHHPQQQKHINVPKQAPPPPPTQQLQQNPANKGPPQAIVSTVTSAAAAGVAAQSTVAGGALQQPQHIREHHNNRLAHHHSQQQPPPQQQQHHTQLMQSQMQKIRQQHQHLNNNNNNITNNVHKGHHHQHYHQQQQQQQYNQLNTSQQHVNLTQSHRGGASSQHHYQQQQQPPPHRMQHLKNQQQHQPNINNNIHINNNNILKTTTQSMLPQSSVGNAQQQKHHNYSNNKAKYNNNNYNKNTNYATNTTNATNTDLITPKTILQNPNRASIKTRNTANASNGNNNNNNTATSTTLTATTATTSAILTDLTNAATKSGSKNDCNNTITNNCSKTTENSSTSNATEATTESASTHARADVEVDDVLTVNVDNSIETNKENIALVASSNDHGELLSNSSSHCHTILSNEDDSATSNNSKEKTPMCLVNELARFNKITHQYRLTGERGPAHNKSFTVTLKLGEEEYTAEGFKIKKAQHLAAAEAIEKTNYKHPLPKMPRRIDDGKLMRIHVTPTVELNALAMKMGQQTYYVFDPQQKTPSNSDSNGEGSPDNLMSPLPSPTHCAVPPPPPPHRMPPPPPPHHPRMMDPPYMRHNAGHVPYGPPPPHPYPRYSRYPSKFHQRYAPLPPPLPPGCAQNNMPPRHMHPHTYPYVRYENSPPRVPSKITLIVGKQKFVGTGWTVQQAKHDAASRALKVLKTQATNQLNEILNTSIEESDNKSPISLVHEIAIKRNMTVLFKVLREEGPAHMKNFITACIVGSIVTEGDGNGKKISKKRSAEKMVEELKKLPPLSPSKSPVRRIKVRTSSKSGSAASSNTKSVGVANSGGVNERRRRPGASIKDKPISDADDDNPITKLIQLQQTRKEKEPVFELIAKNGNQTSRRREFIMEVGAQGMVARGTGGTKKLAKRNAAQNLLTAMGFEEESDATIDKSDSKAKTTTNDSATNAAATLVKNNSNTIANVTKSAPSSTKSAPSATKSAPSATAPKVTRDLCDIPLISTSAGPVPGILILRQTKKNATMYKKKETKHNNANTITEEVEDTKEEPPKTALTSTAVTAMAFTTEPSTSNKTLDTATTEPQNVTTEVRENTTATISNTNSADENKSNTTSGNSNDTNSGTSTTTSTVTQSSSINLHMKEQLLYLAKLMGFEVNFSDYPKGNHNEFLTIVTLSTNPPQICHGVGTSSEESQNDAAKNALKILSELGLNKIK